MLRIARNGLALDGERVRRAYALAVRLFRDGRRRTGRPLLPHVVGTADVLVHAGARTELVVAGLLHPTYLSGVGSRREMLLACAGAEVEALVARYARTTWNSETIAFLAQARLTNAVRDVALLRLANDLEECDATGVSP